MNDPRYPHVSLDVADDTVDEASAALFEAGAQGVEERDATTLAGAPAPGRVTLVAAFEALDAAQRAAAELDPAWQPRVFEVVGDAWRDEWKKHFVPFRLTSRVVIRPPWEPYAAGPSEIVLELEPGRAFGTGLHATSALVARALEARAEVFTGKPMLDVGTGSGILALVGVALGASRARAVDVDPDAVEVAVENAARNGLADRLTADTSPLSSVEGTFAMVTANIEARVLVPMAHELSARVAPGGMLVLSGILETQADDVRRAFDQLALIEVPREGEWVAMVMSRIGHLKF
jgi:ribosomal protein L11 methyltransferase